MKYGFIIDNRKCIGCHACTTACKAEHQVPLGVNRTWVKQVEKGEFPNTRRLFSVMRCNHCTEAPCVEICPVEALFFREDGIVDFDKRRCIGCKSCMQACPYDALYIDPESHTAAKCNYCAHRVDLGLEPACVNVCPEHAIISGDMDDPESEIATLLAREQVTARKVSKGTVPNLFYINGDEASLTPSLTDRSDAYLWNSQSLGVGHYAKEAEKMAFSNGDVISALMDANGQSASAGEVAKGGPAKSIDIMLGQPRRVYDTPEKGVLWGWEVPAYVLTKAISTGAFLLPVLALTGGFAGLSNEHSWWGIGAALAFLLLTGLFLVKDLDRPDRFLNVLLRPQWGSWLVRGGYAITVFGGLVALLALSKYLGLHTFEWILQGAGALLAIIVSVYTAFLFAQAKGRDFWQSPALPLHMLVHTFLAGAAFFGVIALFTTGGAGWESFLVTILMVGIGINLLTVFLELATPHPTVDAKMTVEMIIRGRYRKLFWGGVLLLGNILPFTLLALGGNAPLIVSAASVTVLIGIFLNELIWVEAPQRIPLV
ncbi:MAG: 4Fe-4S dicluster domain-containing protein [Saprospiraceae bacterium]|jgi:Fe-S-cluster-containing dehydrogenase component/formate-dependent nitrite reductase membrane component NrfD